MFGGFKKSSSKKSKNWHVWWIINSARRKRAIKHAFGVKSWQKEARYIRAGSVYYRHCMMRTTP